MKSKRFICFVLIMILFILHPLEVHSATSSYYTTTFSASDPKVGDATLCLKKGFDFIESDSSNYNYELALTASTLSAQVYPAANGDDASTILRNLGYDDVANVSTSMNQFPAVSYAYERLENGKNVFAVVVRGTVTDSDIATDVHSFFSMFAVAGQNIIREMSIYMEGVTGKTLDEIKKEDNYFFFTGHSLGGAVANYMSINETVMGYVNSDKGKIYTYTFESPHTCEALWWVNPESMSNAFNFKVNGDIVTDYPPYMWSTTYGKDVPIKASELNDTTLKSLFTYSKVDNIDGNIGLHDTCLPLIYILDQAKKDGKDISWVFTESH